MYIVKLIVCDLNVFEKQLLTDFRSKCDISHQHFQDVSALYLFKNAVEPTSVYTLDCMDGRTFSGLYGRKFSYTKKTI